MIIRFVSMVVEETKASEGRIVVEYILRPLTRSDAQDHLQSTTPKRLFRDSEFQLPDTEKRD